MCPFVRMCKCSSVCGCRFMCICVYTYVEDRGQLWVLPTLFIYLLSQCLSLVSDSLSGLDWLASEPLGSACFYLLVVRWQMFTTLLAFLKWDFGIQLMSLYLHDKTLLPKIPLQLLYISIGTDSCFHCFSWDKIPDEWFKEERVHSG